LALAVGFRGLILLFFFVCVRSCVSPAGFNTTDQLFGAVQAALRQQFVVDQGLNFNGFLAAAAARYKPLAGARVGTACCGDSDGR